MEEDHHHPNNNTTHESVQDTDVDRFMRMLPNHSLLSLSLLFCVLPLALTISSLGWALGLFYPCGLAQDLTSCARVLWRYIYLSWLIYRAKAILIEVAHVDIVKLIVVGTNSPGPDRPRTVYDDYRDAFYLRRYARLEPRLQALIRYMKIVDRAALAPQWLGREEYHADKHYPPGS